VCDAPVEEQVSEQFARQGLTEAEKTFGPEHRNTEISVGNLATNDKAAPK